MQPCPRGDEATMGIQLEHLKTSHWREDETCSYCGSLSPEALFRAIDEGCELGPTDKNYKVYVDRPDPDVGKPWIYGSANFLQSGPGWVEVTPENMASLPQDTRHMLRPGEWVLVEPKQRMRQNKFYFQHLSVDERKRFIELLNAKALKIGYPGHFYVLPFFMTRQERRAV